ncbi:MAG: alpha/beta hydrolase [Acidimicrobiales bacterium]|nr:alpha/beta hydrolase [Acidimicrobiales bacterium]
MNEPKPYDIPGARHRFVETNGVRLSVYETGQPRPDRPVVVFSHGFPELAFSWRHQLRAVAAAGFHAVAPDQRGYGGSSRPDAIEEYDIFHLTGDLVGLLDEIGAPKAVFVGHDWGGLVTWQMPLLHRERVAGVAGLCTPYVPRFPAKPTEVFRMMGGENHYILYFQEPGVADAALSANTAALFDRMMRRGVDPQLLREAASNASDFVAAIVDAPVLGEELLTRAELDVFVTTFLRTGFTGGLNWYRNFDRNWELTPQLDGARIDGLPCLMITAEWDPVLVPAMAQGMPEVIDDLEMHQVARAGHWVQQEQPDEVNRLLVDWLTRRFA